MLAQRCACRCVCVSALWVVGIWNPGLRETQQASFSLTSISKNPEDRLYHDEAHLVKITENI